MPSYSPATIDLGLGSMLDTQRQDDTEEERRKRRLGLSTLSGNPLGQGRTGIASLDLGVAGVTGVR